MVLSEREEKIALVSSCITTYSIKLEEGELSPNQSVIGFVSKIIPYEYQGRIDLETIEEVLGFISNLNIQPH